MRNRPTNIFSESPPPGPDFDGAWQVDERPTARLIWLFVAIALPLIAVAARLAQLQCRVVDDYIASFEATTESVEPIPSVDGRIYANDGRVLAEDIERYNISVHYRWIEDPPDVHWLTRQALSKLTRAQRRNRALVDAEKRRVLALRDQMWKRLSEITGTQAARVAAKRAAIQSRVKRIADSVAARHADRENQANGTAKNAALRTGAGDDTAPQTRLERIWAAICQALTTPPQREEREPIIVREELDYHPVIDDVPLEVRAAIEAHPRWFPGVRVASSTYRIYHESGFAPHVVGTRGSVSDDDLKQRTAQSGEADPLDYRPGDRIGRSGVEASYDAYLHGLRGLKKLVRNRYGEIVREEVIRAPRPGGDVELTLDVAAQHKMEQLLDSLLDRKAHPVDDGETVAAKTAAPSLIPAGGSVVAIDVESGAVLVAASAPRFDFGSLGTPDRQTWKRLSEDPRRPLFHRAAQMAVPPGSVFKPISAVALLESRKVDPDARFECRGYLSRPDRFRCLIFTQQGVGHGPTDLATALARSCNVYFFHYADVIGPQSIVEWARRFGIGRPTGIDLSSESSGNLPEPKAVAGWHAGDTRSLAIGQSSLTVTPLQIARMMAAVANGGYLVTPFVARKSGPQLADDENSPASSRRQPIPDLSEGTLARIRSAFAQTVSDPAGTGHKTVRLAEIAIAGKTGTAEVGGGKPDHAWFAGYAPADRPRIAFAVVLEHAGSGGKAAGPVARQLVEAFLADGVLARAQVTMQR